MQAIFRECRGDQDLWKGQKEAGQKWSCRARPQPTHPHGALDLGAGTGGAEAAEL